jgi:hypothetical protein
LSGGLEVDPNWDAYAIVASRAQGIVLAFGILAFRISEVAHRPAQPTNPLKDEEENCG